MTQHTLFSEINTLPRWAGRFRAMTASESQRRHLDPDDVLAEFDKRALVQPFQVLMPGEAVQAAIDRILTIKSVTVRGKQTERGLFTEPAVQRLTDLRARLPELTEAEATSQYTEIIFATAVLRTLTRAFDSVRGKSRRKHYGQRVDIDVDLLAASTTEAELIASADLSRLLLQMTEDERRLAEAVIRGESFADVGKELKVLPSTVRQRWSRLKKRFLGRRTR